MNIAIKHIYNDSILTYPKTEELDIENGEILVFSHGELKESVGKVISLDYKNGGGEKIDGEILRVATTEDLEKIEKQKQDSKECLKKIIQKVEELGVSMQIIETRISFDESEVNLLFMAEERIDFKEVVPKLAGFLRKRVYLNQIGMRDRAKETDGYGICGRRQCCSAGVFSKFKSVTMDTVKVQELAMKGAEKLSGPCSKLLCCLNYEAEEYERLRKKMPNWGSRVKTEKGEGKVIALDILNQRVKVYLEKGGAQMFEAKDVKAIKK